MCGSVSTLSAGLRGAEQAAVPGPALDGVRLCMGGLGEGFAPFRHHVVCRRETFCTLVRAFLLFPLSGRKEMERPSCSVKIEGIRLRYFVKCVAFRLGEEELLCSGDLTAPSISVV